ncbi:MAG TPA: rhomboid family intramembrane serine protease [Pseudogracilibacillus sp.]|nr:rhomboid family intramembrane serine protease [Pseudogracilibacillus sp.]
MSMTEQYFMYHTIHELVKNEQYELIHMNPKLNEVWILKQNRNKSTVIRFSQTEFDWKNQLKADIASVLQRVKMVGKSFRGKKIDIMNVYVTRHEPIDQWQSLKQPLVWKDKKEVSMKVYYISEENKVDEKKRFLTDLPEELTLATNEINEVELSDKIKRYKIILQAEIYKKNQARKEIFTYGKPYFTFLFLLLNSLVFLLLEANGGSMHIDTLIQFGAIENNAILDGEWWRIITSAFLHIGALHFFMNMLALYYLGMFVERIYGSHRFFIIYFFAVISGGLTSFALHTNVAAGASGALFGLFGAILYFGLIYRQIFKQTIGRNVILILLINLFIGILIPQIDMGAHLGGLIGGFLAAAIVALPNKPILKAQLGAFVTYALFICLIATYGYGWFIG